MDPWGKQRHLARIWTLPVLLFGLVAHGQDSFTYVTNHGGLIITAYTGSSQEVLIPDSIGGLFVTGIGDSAFAHGSFSFISIATGPISSIGNNAFEGCTGLTTFFIPTLVTNLGYDLFLGCTSLTNIWVSPLNAVYGSPDGVLFNKNQHTLIAYPPAKQGDYEIPGFVREIGYAAFEGCFGLTGVTIPNSVTNLGGRAFIGTALRHVTIGSGVSDLSFGFNGNFFFNTELTEFSVNPSNPAYSSRSGILFNKSGDTLVYYPEGRPGPTILPQANQTSGFGFDIAGTADSAIVVEATAKAAVGPWVPIQTNSLANGLASFVDSQLAKYPARFYRSRAPRLDKPPARKFIFSRPPQGPFPDNPQLLCLRSAPAT
jgi:hypothetical protein